MTEKQLIRKIARNNNQHFASFLRRQPQGDDLFLISVRIPDPSDTCWDSGFIFLGSWQDVRPKLLNLFASGTGFGAHIRIAQGDNARKALEFSLNEELSYQQQKSAQPNN